MSAPRCEQYPGGSARQFATVRSGLPRRGFRGTAAVGGPALLVQVPFHRRRGSIAPTASPLRGPLRPGPAIHRQHAGGDRGPVKRSDQLLRHAPCRADSHTGAAAGLYVRHCLLVVFLRPVKALLRIRRHENYGVVN